MWVSLQLISVAMGSVSRCREHVALFICFLFLIMLCDGLPTVYKRNDQDMLEPDRAVKSQSLFLPESEDFFEANHSSILILVASLLSTVETRYFYNASPKRCDKDWFAVMIPISSTVIPLPVYKVGVVVGIQGEKPLGKHPSDTKLVTLESSRKKAWLKEKSKEQAKIKPVSQEEFINSKELL